MWKMYTCNLLAGSSLPKLAAAVVTFASYPLLCLPAGNVLVKIYRILFVAERQRGQSAGTYYLTFGQCSVTSGHP